GIIRIKINIRIIENQVLYFEVKNNCNRKANKQSSENGIGLENARKRLAAFYPDNKHSLIAGQTDDEYIVVLKINFGKES
ncbi:MAG: sensor histidine kinase, partial [Bacteroidia bacterium]